MNIDQFLLAMIGKHIMNLCVDQYEDGPIEHELPLLLPLWFRLVSFNIDQYVPIRLDWYTGPD